MTSELSKELDEDGCWVDLWTLSRKTHTARKEHGCDECGKSILPGQRYRRVFSVLNGKGVTEKRHTGGEGGTCGGWPPPLRSL
jgi:hypothetical protein